MVAGLAERPAYDGPKQRARRATILETARRLIGEHGADGVSVRRLAEESGVAVKTLYNLFGDKDGVVRAAIEDVFIHQIDSLEQDDLNADPVDLMLRRLSRSTAIILAAPNYARSMAFAYFGARGRDVAADAPHIRSMAANLAQLQRIAAAGGLAPEVAPQEVAILATYQSFAVTAKWAQGHIADQDLDDRFRRALLITLAGATIGQTHMQIRRRLAGG